MRRCLPPLLVGAIVGTAALALVKPAAGRPERRAGRSVRVPRPTAAVATNARFCTLTEDDRGSCFGPVALGDSGAVMSTDGSNWGLTEIVEVTPNLNRCGVAESWNIRIDRARLQSSYYDYGATLVVGMPLGPGAKFLSPGRPAPDGSDATVMFVVDADGDDQADLIADSYPCDQARKPVTTSDPTHQCYEYWVAVRDRWQRGRVDQIANCAR